MKQVEHQGAYSYDMSLLVERRCNNFAPIRSVSIVREYQVLRCYVPRAHRRIRVIKTILKLVAQQMNASMPSFVKSMFVDQSSGSDWVFGIISPNQFDDIASDPQIVMHITSQIWSLKVDTSVSIIFGCGMEMPILTFVNWRHLFCFGVTILQERIDYKP